MICYRVKIRLNKLFEFIYLFLFFDMPSLLCINEKKKEKENCSKAQCVYAFTVTVTQCAYDVKMTSH